MPSIICNNCQTPAVDNAKFCLECGNILSCKNCQSPLVKGAKFCIECGDELKGVKSYTSQPNTLFYHKKGDEIMCDVSVSNEVGKEGFRTLVQGIILGNVPQSYKLDSEEKSNDFTYNLDKVANDIQTQQPSAAQTPKLLEKNEQLVDKAENSYPNIDDLLWKKKFSEMEWLLIFAFYESEYGRNSFSKEQIKDAYYKKRKNESRVKNFSTNWTALRKVFLNTVSEGLFNIEYDKLNLVADLIDGNAKDLFKGAWANHQGAKSNGVTKGKSETIKTSKPSKQVNLEDFDIIKNDVRPSLQEFYSIYKPSSNKEIFSLLAYYVCVYNKSNSFTAGNIEYAFRILKITKKNDLIKAINKVKTETLWFEGEGVGVWKLTSPGIVAFGEMFNK